MLYTVYFPLALIPRWFQTDRRMEQGSSRTPVSVSKVELLKKSTLMLVKMTWFITQRKIDETELENFDNMLMEYRRTLQATFPDEKSKPYIHITQHFTEVIRRFGPPCFTAAWAQERLNGILANIPGNRKMRKWFFLYLGHIY